MRGPGISQRPRPRRSSPRGRWGRLFGVQASPGGTACRKRLRWSGFPQGRFEGAPLLGPGGGCLPPCTTRRSDTDDDPLPLSAVGEEFFGRAPGFLLSGRLADGTTTVLAHGHDRSPMRGHTGGREARSRPSGTAGDVTTDVSGNGYEVTVTNPDGPPVEVHRASSFTLDAQGRPSGCPSGGWGRCCRAPPPRPGQPEPPPTGTSAGAPCSV